VTTNPDSQLNRCASDSAAFLASHSVRHFNFTFNERRRLHDKIRHHTENSFEAKRQRRRRCLFPWPVDLIPQSGMSHVPRSHVPRSHVPRSHVPRSGKSHVDPPTLYNSLRASDRSSPLSAFPHLMVKVVINRNVRAQRMCAFRFPRYEHQHCSRSVLEQVPVPVRRRRYINGGSHSFFVHSFDISRNPQSELPSRILCDEV